MGDRRQIVERGLARFLPGQDYFPLKIHRAMHYAVMNGGKRIRPVMLLEAAKIAGMSEERAVRAACAVEMIHCYSLVHDDLPAMDDDNLRRGKPTCHIVFGEDIAILAGDALLTLAFEMMADCALQDGFDCQDVSRSIALLARAAGSTGMVGGQVVDLEYESCQVAHADLERMHSLKTGELFKAALLIGAVLGGMKVEQQELLRQYAGNFGLAFQISDDILDVCGLESLTGKPTGSDIRNEKTTYTSLFGLEQSRMMVKNRVKKCLESLAMFGPEADFLRNLARFTLERQA